MPTEDCPPGYVRTALGNCIKDPSGDETWRLGEGDHSDKQGDSFSVE